MFRVVRHVRQYEGKVFSLVVDEIEEPSGRRTIREVAEHPGGAVIVPLLDDGRLLLVRQYRYPFGEFVCELPAGKLSHGEDPLVCARRELAEETGYEAKSMTPLGHIYTSPGFCSEKLHIFLARGLHPSADGQHLDEGEETLTVDVVPFQEALEMIRAGEIVDAKTVCGVLLTRDLLTLKAAG